MKSSETALGLDGTKTRCLHQIVWILRIGSLGSKVDSDWPSTEKAVTARSRLVLGTLGCGARAFGHCKSPPINKAIAWPTGSVGWWHSELTHRQGSATLSYQSLSTEAERTISIKTPSTQLFPILILSGCLSKNLLHESFALTTKKVFFISVLAEVAGGLVVGELSQ